METVLSQRLLDQERKKEEVQKKHIQKKVTQIVEFPLDDQEAEKK